MEDQEPSRVETIVKVCVLLWSATLLSLSYYEPPSGKKIVDFDPTFIASIFSASTETDIDDEIVKLVKEKLWPSV